MADTQQEAVFALLADPATHAGKDVTRFDTHAASVFLAGDRAYKVKRAVRFPFLDYSTLQKRKAACAAELEVNRRFAPQLYHRIVPISRDSDGGLKDGLKLDGEGEPVEWAVEMTRFDEAQTLDHVAERGGLRDGLPEKLARMVAAMHRRAEPVDGTPWLAALVNYIDQNTDGFRRHETIFPNAQREELDRRSRAALERLRPLLIERGKRGLIRHCHGDLHLGNIALVDNEPVAFDAIEFDPVIASGDVLYDLAFLLMDLVERDLGGAANTVLNGYFAASRRIEDCDGLAALPLFLSLRAAIRAMVTAARLEQAADDKHDAIAKSATKYFRLALDLLTTPAPKIIATGGLSGTGKSVLAKSLAPFIAPVPGALVLRSDVERKTLFGVGETERLPPEAYQAEVSERVYAVLYDKAARIARAGHSVIADAVFAKENEREAIEAVARDAGVGFQGFHLTADLSTRVKRIGGRGLDASDANAAVARQQEEFALGAVNWTIIDASGTPAETLMRARERLT
jgi:aminoglycoside phosphotransferase family enzyme/predicted kinase